MYLKGSPRKFSDKIALIKQKEALSNASFHSAIHGITKNGQLGTDALTVEIKDNYSSNSYSPDSFTSESTAVSFKNHFPLTNGYADVDNMVNMSVNHENEVFRSCYELSQPNDLYQRQSCSDEVKFRHGNDRSSLITKDGHYSFIDGYYIHNKNLNRLLKPVSSGSLPNVSVWNSNAEFISKYSDEIMFDKDFTKRGHIDAQETPSNLGDRNFSINTKSVLVEHLTNHGLQNPTNLQSYPIQSITNQGSLDRAARISDSPVYRTRKHGFDHGDTNSAGNLMVSGQPKYRSDPNNPYLSLSLERNKAPANDYNRQSSIADSSMKYMKLNNSDNKSYGIVNKSLTPTGNQSNTWFNTNNCDISNGFLQPPTFSDVLGNENWRRVASDSSLQNSLKYQGDHVSQPNNVNDNSFERVNSLKREHVNHPYLRNQSTITYPQLNTHHGYDVSSQFPDFRQESPKVSVSSSFRGNVLGIRNPSVNPEPLPGSGVNMFRSPDNSQPAIFMFNELNNISGDISCDHIQLPLSIKDQPYMPMETNDTYMCDYVNENEIINYINSDDTSRDNMIFQNLNSNTANNTDNHECYWGQSNDTDMVYTNEPSPKTKPCENLDPQNVIVDIKEDFSSIPDITINDAEVQRRDSLNWTVEVLKSLNSESVNCEIFPTRDRSFSGYQPMIALTEEEKILADVIEC